MSKEQSSGRLHLFSLLLVWLSFFFLSCLLIIADVMHVYVRRAISPPSLASKILFGKVLLNWIPKTVVSKIIPWVISSNANISVHERARLGYEICSSGVNTHKGHSRVFCTTLSTLYNLWHLSTCMFFKIIIIIIIIIIISLFKTNFLRTTLTSPM